MQRLQPHTRKPHLAWTSYRKHDTRLRTTGGGCCEVRIMEHVLRCSAVAAMGLATAALMLAMQKAFPAVRLVPCAPIAGEAMHLWAYRPMPAEEPLTIQDRIGAIAHTV